MDQRRLIPSTIGSGIKMWTGRINIAYFAATAGVLDSAGSESLAFLRRRRGCWSSAFRRSLDESTWRVGRHSPAEAGAPTPPAKAGTPTPARRRRDACTAKRYAVIRVNPGNNIFKEDTMPQSSGVFSVSSLTSAAIALSLVAVACAA